MSLSIFLYSSLMIDHCLAVVCARVSFWDFRFPIFRGRICIVFKGLGATAYGKTWVPVRKGGISTHVLRGFDDGGAAFYGLLLLALCDTFHHCCSSSFGSILPQVLSRSAKEVQ